MNKNLYILIEFEVFDEEIFVTDGELEEISIKIPKNVYDTLILSRDFLEVENYIFKKTEFLDLLSEKIEEDEDCISNDFISISLHIRHIFEDEGLSKEIELINSPEDIEFHWKDGVFITDRE